MLADAHAVVRALPLIALALAVAGPVSAGTSPLEAGKATYQRYCALCHGLDGRGAGPLADAMKKTPPDLTALTRNAGGKFPASRFAETVWTGNVPGHGKKAMLEWAKVFGADADLLEATATVLDLSMYVESLQAR